MHFDLIIRHGLIADGTGSPPAVGDVAIKGGLIVEVGQVTGTASEELDATGLLVTPGFVDVHTHYDGQVTWSNVLAPSSGHGVTTVVTGNCGVGFAPVRPDDRQKLIKVMEGVEDIPEVVMAAGIPWNWESFPDYMDSLKNRAFDIDVGVQIGHSPLRVYVMGQRGVDHEPSTDQDRAEMTQLVRDAINAGALGVSTSRSVHHRSVDGQLAPSVTSEKAELLALAEGLRQADGGVFQLIPDPNADAGEEMTVVRDLARASGRPVSFTLLEFIDRLGTWHEMSRAIDEAQAEGLEVRGQVFPRPVGTLFGLDLSFHPYTTRPSCRAISHLPLEERVALMRDPLFKARVLAEEAVPDAQPAMNYMIGLAGSMYRLTDPVDYAPPPNMSMAALAKAAGSSLDDYLYDVLLEDDGRRVLYLPVANFGGGTLESVRAMMAHPHTILGLGDGGAHYGLVCDASFPTFALTYWTRDVDADQRFPVEWIVAELSRRPAEAVGLLDRGLIARGMKADINLIDHEGLQLMAPHTRRDLPANGRRLAQSAKGYVATLVNGEVTYRDGNATGALPGRLVGRVGGGGTPQPL